VREGGNLDKVITSFYEAAIDASLWKPALASLTELFAPAFTSYYFTWDRTNVNFAAVASDDLDTASTAYAQHYGAIDPRAAMIDSGPTGAVFVCHDHFDDAYVSKSEFYNDFLIPIGGRYIIAAKLLDDNSTSGIVSVHRDPRQGPFERADRKLFARVQPHLMQSAKVFQKFTEIRAVKERMAFALDSVPWGVVITDQNARVLQANKAAESVVQRGDALSVRNGRLETIAPGRTSTLHRLIFDAFAAAGGRACSPGGLLRVDRQSGKGYLTVLVAPLRQASCTIASCTSSGVILFITDSERRTIVRGVWLQKLYGLTSAEAAVALGIAQGKTLEEIAKMKAVARNTVRSQTQVILSKMGVRRQAELVGLVLNLPASR
jgi:DNA-binding CsgD family transcriptional regulator